MGSMNLHKKRVKKRKKTNNSDPELVEEGDDAVTARQYNYEKEISSSHSDDAAADGDTIAGKAKGSGKKKKKKKKHVAADGDVELPEKGREGKAKKRGTKKKERVAADEKVELLLKGREDKQKKPHKVGRKENRSAKEGNKAMPDTEVVMDEIYEISSEDEDDSTGMRKWIRQYHENRPGLEVLQQRIDDFVTEYWEQDEQARKDREAKAAEDGWTMVVHKKGGKKTSDPESGVVVGSVNQTAILEKMSQKKGKEVALDFYRFQRREAQRNQVMKLQSKFEEDKKRILKMRAARKFRPY